MVLRMDVLEKLKLSLSSPLKNFQRTQHNELCAIKTWTLPVANFSTNQIRLLLYRDCDRRGRKCLYDSQHVIRDKNGKFSYITTGTNGSELKNLSEYIFGCVPLSSNCGSKRFHKYDGRFVWSQVFSPKRCRQGSASGSISSPPHYSVSTPSESSSAAPLGPSSVIVSAPDEVDGCIARRLGMGMINSLPNIVPALTSPLEKCFSLPSRLADSHQKTLLGLGIMIETAPGSDPEGFGPYLQAISAALEECSTWFSSVATQAYCNPSTFVQTLYDFTNQFKNIMMSRLTNPIVSPSSLVPYWRSLPALTAELTQLILQNDERNCRLTRRIKLVIIGGSKRISEVASLLYLFKILLLQCNHTETEMDVGIDATALCKETDSATCIDKNPRPESRNNFIMRKDTKFNPTCHNDGGSFLSVSSSSQGISLSSTGMSISSMSSPSSPPSPPVAQPATGIQQICVKLTSRKVESEKLQKKDYDSGIELELDNHQSMINMRNGSDGEGTTPGKSMRRSVSQKFESGCGSSSDEHGTGAEAELKVYSGRYSRANLLFPQRQSHEFEEVSFHLGDLTIDCEQSFNTLALSEPNLDKLKTQHGSPVYLERIEMDTKIEQISMEPKEVKINFDDGSHSPKSVRAYCPYCDSIGIVTKFSPLYYIQWVKTTCCSGGFGEEHYNLMKSFPFSKFIVVNLDKGLIRTVNFDGNETCRTTNLPPSSCNSNNSSSLVNNLLHNLQQLLSTERPEPEIDHFLRVQIDFISSIAREFGESWMKSNTEDSSCLKKKYSYLSLSDTDLKLIYSLAKMKYPGLSSQTEN